MGRKEEGRNVVQWQFPDIMTDNRNKSGLSSLLTQREATVKFRFQTGFNHTSFKKFNIKDEYVLETEHPR